MQLRTSGAKPLTRRLRARCRNSSMAPAGGTPHRTAPRRQRRAPAPVPRCRPRPAPRRAPPRPAAGDDVRPCRKPRAGRWETRVAVLRAVVAQCLSTLHALAARYQNDRRRYFAAAVKAFLVSATAGSLRNRCALAAVPRAPASGHRVAAGSGPPPRELPALVPAVTARACPTERTAVP